MGWYHVFNFSCLWVLLSLYLKLILSNKIVSKCIWPTRQTWSWFLSYSTCFSLITIIQLWNLYEVCSAYVNSETHVFCSRSHSKLPQHVSGWAAQHCHLNTKEYFWGVPQYGCGWKSPVTLSSAQTGWFWKTHLVSLNRQSIEWNTETKRSQ